MKHPGLWFVALVWLVPSLGSGIVLWAMPDAVLRSGEAGQFISASAAPGGFFSPSLTSVQTSQGTLVVSDTTSAIRGQTLHVVDSVKGGIQLCSALPMDRCVPLAGDFIGLMHSNPNAPSKLSHGAWEFWCGTAEMWFCLGAAIFWLVASTLAQANPDANNREWPDR